MSRVLIILIFSSLTCFAGDQPSLSAPELAYFNGIQDSMCKAIHRSIKAKDDGEKLDVNAQLMGFMEEGLEKSNSEWFPFDSLVKYKYMIISPDREVRIFTWDVYMDDRTHRYYGFIQHTDLKTKRSQLFKLEDKSEDAKNAETANFTADKWFGAFYYKIVETVYKKKKYYTLLGWDGNDRITQKKIIDMLTFATTGEPQFSEGSFEVHKFVGKTDKELIVWQKRVIFEFKQNITMSLKYDSSVGLIIYDHLSPEESNQRGQYQYYGPDLSLDAYKFKKGKWLYVKDASGKNSKTKGDKKYNSPTTDPNAPHG